MGKDECSELVVGLDGAGKTTIVQRLKYGVSEDMEVIPTIGFNIECVEYKKMIFSLWDLGGAKETRSFWRFYYEGSQGIIFVFDSTSDALRVEEAREDLHRLLTEHELWDAPLLVMANKQDEPRAMAPREITEKLQLYSLANRNWCVQAPMQAQCRPMAVRGRLPRRLTVTRPLRGQVYCGHQGAASRREGGKPPRRSRAMARLKECPPPANPRACRHGARLMDPRSAAQPERALFPAGLAVRDAQDSSRTAPGACTSRAPGARESARQGG